MSEPRGSPLIVALPSKGRLKDQVEEWLADCGLDLVVTGGARGYLAALKGIEGAQVRLISAGDIAEALDLGQAHLGVTGEDLLAERGAGVEDRVAKLIPLGFGRADVVVAVPNSWLDVETMADLEEVGHDILARTGRRMRVATKFLTLTRTFFARHGVADYRIAESGGATEGAPGSGAAELIVDITTTGATLEANGLRVLADGVILKSQSQLAASLRAAWSPGQRAVAERLLRVVEARAAARASVTLVWPPDSNARGEAAVAALVAAGATRRPNGLLVEAGRAASASGALTAAGLGPVTAARPDFVFDVACPSYELLASRLRNI